MKTMKTKILTVLFGFSLTMNALATDATPPPTPQPDKLKDALAEMITGVTQTASTAKDFIVSQLPDVIQQLLWWKFAESLIGSILPLVAALILLPKFFKWISLSLEEDEKSYSEQRIEPFVKSIAFGIAGFITLIVLIYNVNLTWLQIWIAPKVYLIEFAKDLIHK